MKNKPISFFLFLALAFIHEANAGKIVGALEASYGTIISPEYELMDREWEPFGNETWEPFGNETTDIGKTKGLKGPVFKSTTRNGLIHLLGIIK